MKKIIMLSIAVACATIVNAASIDWKVAQNSWYLSDDTTKAGSGTTVYLIDAAYWSDIKSAIDAGATSFANSDVGIIDIAAVDNTRGRVSETKASSSALVAGNSYDFAYLVFDTTADKYFASATINEKAYDASDPEAEPTLIGFSASHYTTPGLSSGWQSVTPIPEPTSGLLLLMGGALLALRRKQK